MTEMMPYLAVAFVAFLLGMYIGKKAAERDRALRARVVENLIGFAISEPDDLTEINRHMGHYVQSAQQIADMIIAEIKQNDRP